MYSQMICVYAVNMTQRPQLVVRVLIARLEMHMTPACDERRSRTHESIIMMPIRAENLLVINAVSRNRHWSRQSGCCGHP